MKIIRLDMGALRIEVEEVSAAYRGLGGRGLTSTLLAREVAPGCNPLGPENKLVIAPGLLTGTGAPCSGRTSVGAKSPLTGTIKESNVGGIAGQYLAGQRIKALVFEGRPPDGQTRILHLDAQGGALLVRNDLAGLGNYQAVAVLRQEYGPDSAVIAVGPAGEVGALLGTIAVCDREGRPARHAGRGGMGAVLAAKGIKAVVIARPAVAQVPVAEPQRFRDTVRRFARTLVEGKKALTTYGTAVLVNVVNEAGGLPTRNFSRGSNDRTPDFDGERLHRLAHQRGGTTGHGCHAGCVIRCSNVYHDAAGEYLTAGLEYETIALLGSNCGLHDLDAIARLDRLCDDLGIDTMEMGVALGVAMEAGVLPFGDFAAMQAAIRGVVAGTPIGRTLARGATFTGRTFDVERVPAVKGQALSGYDPRALKGTGVTYATSTMGADHTTGNCLPGRGGLDSHKPEGQARLSRELQVMSMVCDILGVCVFVGPVPETMPFLAELVAFASGAKTTPERLLEQGLQVLRIEAEFNRGAGITNRDNDLPAFFRNEPLPGSGLVFDVPVAELAALDFAAPEVEEIAATARLPGFARA